MATVAMAEPNRGAHERKHAASKVCSPGLVFPACVNATTMLSLQLGES